MAGLNALTGGAIDRPSNLFPRRGSRSVQRAAEPV